MSSETKERICGGVCGYDGEKKTRTFVMSVPFSLSLSLTYIHAVTKTNKRHSYASPFSFPFFNRGPSSRSFYFLSAVVLCCPSAPTFCHRCGWLHWHHSNTFYHHMFSCLATTVSVRLAPPIPADAGTDAGVWIFMRGRQTRKRKRRKQVERKKSLDDLTNAFLFSFSSSCSPFSRSWFLVSPG